MQPPADLAVPDARAVARRLLGGVSVYSLALFAPRLVRLATIPAIAWALSPREYGTYAALWLITPFVHIAADVGFGTAALRLTPEAPTEEARRALWSAVLAVRFALTVLVVALVVATSAGLSRLLTGSGEHGSLVVLMALSLVPATLWDAFTDQLRSEERHHAVAGLIVLRTLLANALVVLLVVALHGGVRGMMTAALATEAVLFVVTAWLCRPVLRVRPAFSAVGKLFAFGAPLGVLNLIGNLRDLDRYLLARMSGLGAVGGYDLTTRLVAPVALANEALGLALEPHVFRTFRSPRTGVAVPLFLRGYVALFTGVALAISLLAPEILGVLTPASYHALARVVPLLVFTYVAEGVVRVAGLGGDLAKRTRLWAVAAIVNAAVSLPLTLLLVPQFGVGGAGFGLLVGTVAAAAVSYALARRVHALSLPVTRSLAIIAIAALVSTAFLGGVTGVPAPLGWRLAALLPLAAGAFVASGFELRAVRELLA